jgi:DNA-directed RNA polymerase subunit RPC12/RpoP
MIECYNCWKKDEGVIEVPFNDGSTHLVCPTCSASIFLKNEEQIKELIAKRDTILENMRRHHNDTKTL